MARNPSGAIAIVSRDNRLRLQFPRPWHQGKQKYHALNLPDTTENRAYAATLIRQMEWDYLSGCFDASLTKYIQVQQQAKELTIGELWAEFCVYKARNLKAASIYYLTQTLGGHIVKSPYQNISSAIEIRSWLLDRTTPAMARNIIASLATAVKWGMKHQKISLPTNPFAGMSEDIRVDRELQPPNAFTLEEQDRILEAFAQSRYYSYYLPIVKFWLLTGCRPSEAIGLEWEQVAPNRTSIRFDRSIGQVGGKSIRNNRSKTNRVRVFPANERLQLFLIELDRARDSNQLLVFPSRNNQSIDYKGFSARAWKPLVKEAIGRHSTPYSCRDTFITHQIGQGVPIAVIAKWVDNSVKMIESRYLDPTALDRFKPL